MHRIVKILLILSVAMWGTLGAFGNFDDWEGTKGAVEATTSMVTFEESLAHWRATSNTVIIMIGAVLIPFLKLLTAALCFLGAWKMWGARKADAAVFHRASYWALTGCGVAMFMLFAGWIVIAETWFELWRSDVLRDASLQAAFRYCGMIGVIALFVGMRED
ncbi:MAG: DUF2165 family protein [Hyphomonadaceae bacterium]|nr:DUF2165 family protein [Hyphomonadaceae bacterium]